MLMSKLTTMLSLTVAPDSLQHWQEIVSHHQKIDFGGSVCMWRWGK